MVPPLKEVEHEAPCSGDLLEPAALRADSTPGAGTITVTSTGSYFNAFTNVDDCANGPCSPFNISVPQFDPSLGTLTSITWTFTDSQQYYGGMNDMYDPLIGDPTTWTTTEGDESAQLGLDASDSQFNSTVTCGCRQISMGGFWNMDNIQASGTVPDDNPFIGTGTLNIPITPFVSATFPRSSKGWVDAAILSTEDGATLTVTETYTTPEPSGSIAVLAVAFLALLSLKAKTAGPHY